MILSHHQRLQPEVSVFLLWRRKWWKCRLQPFLVHDIFATKQFTTVTVSEADNVKCDRYKSINIEVSISISILLWQSIDIGINDTFKTGIDIEYRQYFWKISITTLMLVGVKSLFVFYLLSVCMWTFVVETQYIQERAECYVHSTAVF